MARGVGWTSPRIRLWASRRPNGEMRRTGASASVRARLAPRICNPMGLGSCPACRMTGCLLLLSSHRSASSRHSAGIVISVTARVAAPAQLLAGRRSCNTGVLVADTPEQRAAADWTPASSETSAPCSTRSPGLDHRPTPRCLYHSAYLYIKVHRLGPCEQHC